MKWGLKLGERIIVPPKYRKILPPVGVYCAFEESACRGRGYQDTYRSGDHGFRNYYSGYASIVGRCHVCRYGGYHYGWFVRIDGTDHFCSSGNLLYFL